MATSNTLRAIAPALNTSFNAATAYLANRFVGDGQGRNIAVLVALDTLFRITITHVLSALKIPYLLTGSAGHLLFPCLTLLSQPLSVIVADKFVGIDHRWYTRKFFIALFGYIALSWKVNSMIKDVMYIFYPSLKRM